MGYTLVSSFKGLHIILKLKEKLLWRHIRRQAYVLWGRKLSDLFAQYLIQQDFK